METSEELDEAISELRSSLLSVTRGKGTFSGLWKTIQDIRTAFRSVRYPSSNDYRQARTTFESAVEEITAAQAKAAAAETEHLQRRLAALESLIEGAGAGHESWGAVWQEIKAIGAAFKAASALRPDDREELWKTFQSYVTGVKAQQEESRAQSAQQTSKLAIAIDEMKSLILRASVQQIVWGEVWSHVKGIHQAFKETRFATGKDRRAEWARFQMFVSEAERDQLKASQKVFAPIYNEAHWAYPRILHLATSLAIRWVPCSSCHLRRG